MHVQTIAHVLRVSVGSVVAVSNARNRKERMAKEWDSNVRNGAVKATKPIKDSSVYTNLPLADHNDVPPAEFGPACRFESGRAVPYFSESVIEPGIDTTPRPSLRGGRHGGIVQQGIV